VPCLQKNIQGFLNSKEKYLFLFTRRSDSRGERIRYIVGYLMKQRCLLRSHLDKRGRVQRHFAVQGPITLVSFNQAFQLRKLRGVSESASNHLRFKKLNKEQTTDLLVHFRKGRNIFPACVCEVRRLKKMLAKKGSNAGCSHTCRN
jgi:hypothetical protein